MSYKIASIVPQLPVLDFEQAKEYYTNKLGCVLVSEYPDLLILLMNDMELHLWKCDDKAIPESSSCYIRVENIESLYEKYNNGHRIVVPLTLQPWGMTEFYIMDPSGNLLKFGEKK